MGKIKNTMLVEAKTYTDSKGSVFTQRLEDHYMMYVPKSISKESILDRITQGYGGSPKKKKKKVNRPFNSFILYRMDKMPEIIKETPTLNQKYVSQQCAKMWNNEKPEVKECYRQKYEKLKLEHKRREKIEKNKNKHLFSQILINPAHASSIGHQNNNLINNSALLDKNLMLQNHFGTSSITINPSVHPLNNNMYGYSNQTTSTTSEIPPPFVNNNGIPKNTISCEHEIELYNTDCGANQYIGNSFVFTPQNIYSSPPSCYMLEGSYNFMSRERRVNCLESMSNSSNTTKGHLSNLGLDTPQFNLIDKTTVMSSDSGKISQHVNIYHKPENLYSEPSNIFNPDTFKQDMSVLPFNLFNVPVSVGVGVGVDRIKSSLISENRMAEGRIYNNYIESTSNQVQLYPMLDSSSRLVDGTSCSSNFCSNTVYTSSEQVDTTLPKDSFSSSCSDDNTNPSIVIPSFLYGSSSFQY
ncbi:Transcription factor ste11 [Zancudomyces culisetae]|uniref:Transcription factor ste11 n=1 Tax=Zancudomyces culisetae TaxID=1213189 RepID=A0A1R1PCS8_ZANCU|nr:Transcription factor ste11 [Zancudomyces culisetae]|eukprot:OMH78777.1 Transcription factor ste11 [Zancudomyces culisetae]